MKRKLILLTLLSLSQNCNISAFAFERDEYWPFPRNPSEGLYRGMGPQDKEVSFIINGRPAGYSKQRFTDYKAIEALLKRALNRFRMGPDDSSPVLIGSRPIADLKKVKDIIAQAANPNLFMTQSEGRVNILYRPPAGFHASTEQVNEVLTSLAIVEYKSGRYSECIKLLHESLELEKQLKGTEHTDLSNTLDFLGMVYRAEGNFEQAESSYLKALSVRQKSLHPYDSRLATSYKNLANLYSDKGDSVLAAKFRAKAEDIKRQGGSQAAAMPIPTSIDAPTYETWSSFSTAANTILDGYKQSAAARSAEIMSIRALVRNLLVEKFPDEGGSYVYGTAQVALDRSDSLVFNKRIADKIEGGKTEREPAEKSSKLSVSEVQDFSVVLCPYGVKSQVEGAIARYARRYGFPLSDYQKTWPGIREQAKEIILEMEPVVNQSNPKVEAVTNAAGEFELKDVKRGSYCIFGYLITKEKAMYWLHDLPVTGKTPVRFDFLLENSTLLWEKNKVAPTPQAIQMGTASGGSANMPGANGLVPPPPPAIFP